MATAGHGRTVSYEDLKLMGLGKAVDEYHRISRRARSSSRVLVETGTCHSRSQDSEPGATRARGILAFNDAIGAIGVHGAPHEEEGRPAPHVVPPARPPSSRVCVCLWGACTCVLTPPLPGILFERQVWAMAAALSVPFVIRWCMSRCSLARLVVSCVTIFVIAQLSRCLQCDACMDHSQEAIQSLGARFPELEMTTRETDVAGGQLEEVYHDEDLAEFRREREVMAHVERLVARYGYDEGHRLDHRATKAKIDSMVTAYVWISRLAREMHLGRRHQRVSSLGEAVESVAEIATQLGVH